MTMINDAHCHFFSSRFLELLAPESGGADQIVAQYLSDAAVQNLALAPEQILISRVGNERVLETIASVRRQAPYQQDVRLGEPIQRGL